MEVIVLPTAQDVGIAAAGMIARLVANKPDAVLGLATGASVTAVYEELKALDFSRVTTFNLDEYVGLAPSHPASFHAFMETHLFSRVNIDRRRAHFPPTRSDDLARSCEKYERDIRSAGGIDLQLLGIGRDGHLGFNEPTSSLASRTRIKTLTRLTREANQPAFGTEQVPLHVVTMGIATLLEARHCLLIADGPAKAAAVAQMVEGPLSAMVPASALQLHPHATVIVDEDAAAGLSLRDYYREVQRNKPQWQR
ncbi:MAG TPA: glucosamine-6-phosphate deaminase [Burkholderiales bacterium]|jgi:glucosamine-6-phosphate deaminase|nr:glucosamine-6-phosphate deaminase [Burkholderiales bacterium]